MKATVSMNITGFTPDLLKRDHRCDVTVHSGMSDFGIKTAEFVKFPLLFGYDIE